MKFKHCYLCNQEVPMLDEEETRQIHKLYWGAAKRRRAFRDRHSLPKDCSLEDFWLPVRQTFAEITGQIFASVNDAYHGIGHALERHRLSRLIVCLSCDWPLRKYATACPKCGTPRPAS